MKFICTGRNRYVNDFPLYRLIKIVYEVLEKKNKDAKTLYQKIMFKWLPLELFTKFWKKKIRMQIVENNV